MIRIEETIYDREDEKEKEEHQLSYRNDKWDFEYEYWADK